MEVSPEMSKSITNSMNNISADNNMNNQKLEGVISFRYLGATLCKDITCRSLHEDCLSNDSNGQTKQDLG